ncbi:MAG: dihydroxy-acid dehydratase [Erysipelotrichaceae bacterium]
MFKHQKIKMQAPEMDALKMGTNCQPHDFNKGHIIIESSFGDSHPGSVHLDKIVNRICQSFDEADKYKGFRYFATDICDGIAQGHSGMNYSLVSREAQTDLIEIHAKSNPFDAGIFVASCDKSLPAHMQAIARVNIPSILIPGGVMNNGSMDLTLNQIGEYNVKFKKGEISESEFDEIKESVCPNSGACSFLGTATTMQIMAEALGLTPLGMAVAPSDTIINHPYLKSINEIVDNLIKNDITPDKIITKKSLENAMVIHAAISGSTNTLIHLPAIASEMGLKMDWDFFNKINKKVSKLVNIKPVGIFPAEYYSYAGGSVRIMNIVRNYLNLDCLTVTGRSLGAELDLLINSGYIEKNEKLLLKYNLKKEDIIFNKLKENKLPTTTILKGNLAEDGCVIKTDGLDRNLFDIYLSAKVYKNEATAFEAIIKGEVKPYSAIIVANEGPRGSGMPEMFYLTEALAKAKELADNTALITDGRFSGASNGPVIGHVSPEASNGGAIGKVVDGDLIHLDLINQTINICNQDKKILSNDLLNKRKSLENNRTDKGILARYRKTASSAMEGAKI